MTGATSDRVEGIQQLWTDGDYAAVGDGFAPAARRLIAQLRPEGQRLLDAATGTGNLAIAAARAGAHVDAFDLTPALLDEARRRAAAAGVDVRFVEGDLLDVPYPDGTFDLVVSTFGAFLADDPARCASELLRVARPGGRVVATAWSPRSAFVRMVEVMHEVAPDLVPTAAPSPWADERRLAELVASDVEVDVTEAELWLPFPSADDAVAFYERTSGPVRRFRSAVGDELWATARTRTVARWHAASRPAGDHVELPATYTIATLGRAVG